MITCGDRVFSELEPRTSNKLKSWHGVQLGLGPLSFIRPKVLTSCIDEINYGFRSYKVVQHIMKMVYRLTKKTVNVEYGYRSTHKT